MFFDFHTHLLCGIDDGSSDVNMTLSMIEMLKKQGVVGVSATPHFNAHEESIDSFLERRNKSYDLIKNRIDIPIILGAEVALERDLSNIKDLKKLCYGDSSFLLIELPYNTFKDWMVEEIYNIAYAHDVIPVLAHIDRYYPIYKKDQLEAILNIQDVIFQFNNSALLDRKKLKLVLKMIKDNQKIIFGSDTHNITTRPPNFDDSMKKLNSKLSSQELKKTLVFSKKLFNFILNS